MSALIPGTREVLALKTVFRRLVEAVGGLEAAASVTRVSTTTLATYYHPQILDRFAPVDVVAVLEAVAQEPMVTAELARLAGQRLVHLEDSGAACLATQLAGAAREAGEAIAAQLSGAPPSVVQREALEASAAFAGVAAVVASRMVSPTAPAVEGEGTSAPGPKPSSGRGGRQPRKRT